jgi:hypothetical protein
MTLEHSNAVASAPSASALLGGAAYDVRTAAGQVGLPTTPPRGLLTLPAIFLVGVALRGAAQKGVAPELMRDAISETALLVLGASVLSAWRIHDKGLAWGIGSRARLQRAFELNLRNETSFSELDVEQARLDRNAVEERNAVYRSDRLDYQLRVSIAIVTMVTAALAAIAGSAFYPAIAEPSARLALALAATVTAGLIGAPLVALAAAMRAPQTSELTGADKEAIERENAERRRQALAARSHSQFYADVVRATRSEIDRHAPQRV